MKQGPVGRSRGKKYFVQLRVVSGFHGQIVPRLGRHPEGFVSFVPL